MNDQEFLDQYKRELGDSLPLGEPELEMTPEFIEELWQQAQARLEQQAERRKARRMSLLRWSLSAAASVALLVGIGLQLWQPDMEGGLSSLPQPDRAELRPPASPSPAAPEDRLVSPSSQIETGPAPTHPRQSTQPIPSRRGDGACPVTTEGRRIALEDFENFESVDNFENFEPLESPSQPSSPSAIRTLSDAEY